MKASKPSDYHRGYSPLRRWLREERARDHEAWGNGPACPHCSSRNVESIPPKWGQRAFRCVTMGHRWEESGSLTATWLLPV